MSPQIDDWLVTGNDLTSRDRASDFALELDSLLHALVHFAVVEAVEAAAFGLRSVHRPIGLTQRRLDNAAVEGDKHIILVVLLGINDGNANACANDNAEGGKGNRLWNFGNDTAGKTERDVIAPAVAQ